MIAGDGNVETNSRFSLGDAMHEDGATALFLVNHQARSGRKYDEQIREKLTRGGLKLIGATCHQPNELSTIVRRYRDEVDLVIIGGGDGTIHHALAGLIETKLPLGILPLGTANDLARTLNLPTDPIAACDVILNGRVQDIDIGLFNGEPFCNVASLGLAVQITDRLQRSTKSRWGVLAYAFAAIQSLMQARPFGIEICCDGICCEARTIQVTIGNGRYYGGGFKVDESASITDQLLHLYSLEVKRWWHLIPLLPALRSGALNPLSNVRNLQGTDIRVTTRGGSRRIVADGEIVGTTPGEFRLLPRAMKVFAPS